MSRRDWPFPVNVFIHHIAPFLLYEQGAVRLLRLCKWTADEKRRLDRNIARGEWGDSRNLGAASGRRLLAFVPRDGRYFWRDGRCKELDDPWWRQEYDGYKVQCDHGLGWGMEAQEIADDFIARSIHGKPRCIMQTENPVTGAWEYGEEVLPYRKPTAGRREKGWAKKAREASKRK